MPAYQFLSRLFTDGLGRAPEGRGWGFWQSEIEKSVSVDQLRGMGSSFFNSEEFAAKKYTTQQRISTLYRVALSREANAGEVINWTWQIDSGRQPFSNAVMAVFGGDEFARIAPSYLNTKYDLVGGTPYRPAAPRSNAYYVRRYEGGFYAVDETNGIRNSTELQTVLNSLKPGDILSLAQGAIVEVTSQIVMPSGVILDTHGNPGTDEYQKMARLYRSSNYNDGNMIALLSGSALNNVWVDGQRNTANNPNWKPQNINVGLLGGDGASAEYNRIDNSLGFSHLTIAGQSIGLPKATNILIRGNFFDGTTSNYSRHWADGVSNGGEQVTIEDNVFINMTDVSVVGFAFNIPKDSSQDSIIRRNLILNLSNSSYGGLVSDGVFDAGGVGSAPGEVRANAFGLTFEDNILWTSNGAFMSIALSAGTRAWFGDSSQTIDGTTFKNNSSDGQKIRVGSGIVASGALNVTVEGNVLNFVFAPEAKKAIPRMEFVASVTAGYASFRSFDMEWIDRQMNAEIIT
ncbi:MULTISPECIES: DUF4214 domain-containing protein [Leptolyngbya]|uniref:DUF4214 domain-containing protein n=1 Tax=Leptolyngbya TaxID=47251 RepID=UPI001683A20A|nr:DUF4214 domain-containing protein [Leptolyngbya sp. FACHB-1624]MBD1857705.1 DUF4214 domain-containing protein [Leptolyngbya sp. FACHB-1624]